MPHSLPMIPESDERGMFSREKRVGSPKELGEYHPARLEQAA